METRILDNLSFTDEPLASLEYNIRAAFDRISQGDRTGLAYLLAAIGILEQMANDYKGKPK